MKTKTIGVVQLIIGILLLGLFVHSYFFAVIPEVPSFLYGVYLLTGLFAIFTAIPNLKSKK